MFPPRPAATILCATLLAAAVAVVVERGRFDTLSFCFALLIAVVGALNLTHATAYLAGNHAHSCACLPRGSCRRLRRRNCRCGDCWSGSCRRGIRPFHVAQVDGRARPGVEYAKVLLVEFLRAHDVGNYDEDDFIVLVSAVFGTEKVPENGNGAEGPESGEQLSNILKSAN